MTLGIPKTLGHIWIGHRQAPTDWMDSWRDLHPDWDYQLYDNDYLCSRKWRNQALINAFYRKGDYPGVSDLMRYEILFDHGGFIPEADSICLRATDELWDKPALYTVWENEEMREGLVSPFLASAKGHPYLERLIIRARRRNDPNNLRPAWRAVGNRFLMLAMKAIPPTDTVIFPSHYFIPTHKKSKRYEGDGPVYCEQVWGSTLGLYKEAAGRDNEAFRAGYIENLEARLENRAKAA